MAQAFNDIKGKFNKLPKYVQQSILGSLIGFATGYSSMRFGKAASLSLGASVCLLHLGHRFGYIKIDWSTVNRDLKKAKEEVKKQASTHAPELHRQIQDAIEENIVTCSSFIGGFLLGFSAA